MDLTTEQLEALWDNLLSSQPELVRAAFDSLDSPSQKTVLAHLQRMASDTGWQPEQQASALAAIQILKYHINREE